MICHTTEIQINKLKISLDPEILATQSGHTKDQDWIEDG